MCIYIHIYIYIDVSICIMCRYVSYLDDYFGLMVSIHWDTERSRWYVKWLRWYAKETHVRCKGDLCDVYTFWKWRAKETCMIQKRDVCDTKQLNMMRKRNHFIFCIFIFICERDLCDMQTTQHALSERLVWYEKENHVTCKKSRYDTCKSDLYHMLKGLMRYANNPTWYLRETGRIQKKNYVMCQRTRYDMGWLEWVGSIQL